MKLQPIAHETIDFFGTFGMRVHQVVQLARGHVRSTSAPDEATADDSNDAGMQMLLDISHESVNVISLVRGKPQKSCGSAKDNVVVISANGRPEVTSQ